MPGAIEEAQLAGCIFISHFFLRLKKDRDFWPMLNLARLNEMVIYLHFKIEQLATVVH